MTKFTIITVTYNAEAVVRRTLDSVLRQTYEDVEHLVIDGASADGTWPMVEAYKAESDRRGAGHKVTVKSEPDKGIYDAMNKGLMQATGDYVIYMNAGDIFPADNTLEEIAHRCKLNECASAELPAVLYGSTDIVDGEGHFLRHRRLQPPAELNWRSFRHGMLVCHQAFYARMDIAKMTPYNNKEYRYSADVDWCIRVMHEAERMELPLCDIGMVVANYMEEGTSTVHHRASLWERFQVMRRHYGLMSTVGMHLWFAVRAVLKR